jgi:hypothetical protein
LLKGVYLVSGEKKGFIWSAVKKRGLFGQPLQLLKGVYLVSGEKKGFIWSATRTYENAM